MAEKKLPKGVQSLGDIARRGGRGGQLLKYYRGFRDNPADFTTRGQRTWIRFEAAKEVLLKKRLKNELRPIAKNPLSYEKPPAVAAMKISDIRSSRIVSTPDPYLGGHDLLSASKIRSLARAAGKLSAIGQIATLPLQYEETKKMLKPKRLHEREQEASARRM